MLVGWASFEYFGYSFYDFSIKVLYYIMLLIVQPHVKFGKLVLVLIYVFLSDI